MKKRKDTRNHGNQTNLREKDSEKRKVDEPNPGEFRSYKTQSTIQENYK